MGAVAIAAPAPARPLADAVSAVRSPEVILLAVAGATAAAGLVTFLIRVDLLSPYPGTTPFAGNVALAMCALVAGVALDGTPTARVLGGLAALIGGWTLAQHVVGVDLGIDRLIFDPFRATSASGHPGRMAPNTAVCFLLAGLALVVRTKVGVALAVIPSVIGLVAALGYTDPQAKALASIGQSVNMTLPTAIGVAFASFALVLIREREYFARVSIGGSLTRRLGPLVVALPILCSALLLEGIRRDELTAATGIWMMTVVAVLTAFGLLLWISRLADRQESRTHAGLSLHAETAANLSEGLCLRREDDGQVIAVNPALERTFGYTPGTLEGTSTLFLTEENEAAMRATLAERGSFAGEVETVRADGTTFWCSVKSSTFKHPDHGRLRVALYYDVTGHRAAEARRVRAEQQRGAALVELERSNKELEQFAHVASHDLSEPLRVIGGFVSLLERRYAGQLDADADRFIGATVSGVERMQALIDALLAYSHVGSGQLQLAQVDMAVAAGAAVDALGASIEETGGRVVVDDLPTVSGDPRLLERVFQNLISNSLKFTDGAAPHVAISAQPSPEGWTFRVTDNGVGIPPEQAERVFGMFQRLRGRDHPGTGIGLSITRRIIEKHGGRIWAEPGEPTGTVFRFTLPSGGHGT